MKKLTITLFLSTLLFVSVFAQTIQSSSYSTIGYARGVAKEWAAVVFFFFKFE